MKVRVKTSVLVVVMYILAIALVKAMIIDHCNNTLLIFGLCWSMVYVMIKVLKRLS